MIYAETLEALCELPNEDLGALIKHINNWNNGIEVIIENPFHKSMWKVILPDLERNKETYLSTLENRQRAGRENGKLGGRPRKDKITQEKVIGLSENLNNPNCNSNYINSSKEELINTPQPLSSDDDSVVSKGLEKLESIFPQGRNSIGIDDINTWNSLTQDNKAHLIKRATLYIRNQMKDSNGKFIKNISKWIKEEVDKLKSPQQASKSNGTSTNDERLLMFQDGNITNMISSITKNQALADKLYLKLNKKSLFHSKEEFYKAVYLITNEITESDDLVDIVSTLTRAEILEITK